VDEDTRAIEREITVEREALGSSLRELEYQARTMTDWRHHYRNHTGAALGATFGAGVLLGLLVPARSKSAPREYSREYLDIGESWEPERAPQTRRRESNFGFRGLKSLSQNTRAGRQVSDTAVGIFDTLVGLAATKAVELVANFIPGFRDEYHSRHGSRPRTADSRF